MDSPDDDINKRKAEATPNERDRDEQWDAARLKGWHKTEWEDRTVDGSPEHKAEPWYYWVVIGVLATVLLLPLFVLLSNI